MLFQVAAAELVCPSCLVVAGTSVLLAQAGVIDYTANTVRSIMPNVGNRTKQAVVAMSTSYVSGVVGRSIYATYFRPDIGAKIMASGMAGDSF